MEKRNFVVESSPHVFASNYKYKTMWLVFAALIPAFLMGVYNFGIHAFNIVAVSISVALLTEAVMNLLLKRESTFKQGAAAVTGLLLGLILPPTVPLWIPALGSFIAITIGKYVFGGPGNTIFNPALVGRAFLVASFPALLTRYIWPDGVTSASPLSMLKMQ
jgi:electron transport complex protein RnfD